MIVRGPARCPERGSATRVCPACLGAQVGEVLSGDAIVLRCSGCRGLTYIPRRTVRGRVRTALVTAITRYAPPTSGADVGTWIVWP